MSRPVRIAQLTCGADYSGVQNEIAEAAKAVDAEVFYPDISLNDLRRDFDSFGLNVKSPDLKLVIARAKALVTGKVEADAVFIGSCFRCAEAAIVRTELRRYIHMNSTLPVVSYSFTERTTSGTLLTRMEALTTIARRRALLAREKQTGITMGVDSGSSTTKCVIMKENEIIGTGWEPTIEVLKSSDLVVEAALAEAGLTMNDIEAIGTTGYGRFLIGKHLNADLVQEELTVNSKGAVYLADNQHGPATVIDIGGMDNKAISVMDGIPGTFTMGGICAGASGRFLEMTAKRLGIDITELGPLAMKGMGEEVPMNSYCIVFGTQSLVNALAAGSTPEDVAAAACHSVAEQVFEQQLQEIDIREPVIMVGGTSLIQGLVRAMGELLQTKIIVPHHSQYIGATGAALLASGFVDRKKE
ncbi:MAG: Putative methanogenesis marker protein 15 [Methanomicrobiales archaeon 53_19]|jgi:putative methanogenesis marker protein 15|uniref:methanogenesis marker 15 protein n=1 Tax=Methanocalculus sp. TaxID=2004547 RepID=UPI00074AC739|nr:methanogenesis marker 15 protein [Methanocalculus sp.]KUK68862.1 MAG: Putative methanogenesis marker protein 15 [Methanocalculus sp. 52_23]KUL01904.1 MAG: Putative methanogenesis marker protein 15 [Methanomicrobiales archaeon 53_19]HIJ06980.1 methanogenesis marker 15 protein [Methanocalculus sp.]